MASHHDIGELSGGNARSRLADGSAGPWSTWRTRKMTNRCVRFIEEHCRPAKGHGAGRPLTVARFQREWLEEALESDPPLDASILSLPRGNGKSTFVGAVATWALFDEKFAEVFGGQPDIPVIATEIRQALRSCYGAALAFIRTDPDLSRRCLVYTANDDRRVVVPRNSWGTMYPAAANATTLQGLDPSVALVDEIGHMSIEAWDALLEASGKRPRSLIIGLGTKRPDDRPNALDHLLGRAALHGELPGVGMTVYEADPMPRASERELAKRDRDREQWRRANPGIAAGILRESAIRTALGASPVASFRTFRLNVKGGALESWLGPKGPDHWSACEGPVAFSSTEPVNVGVDKSAYNDSSAVVATQRQGDRLMVRARIWTPGEFGLDHAEVRQHLRDLCAELPVRAIGYDVRYFVEGADELEGEGLPMIDIPQTPARMVPAYQALYRAITQHELRHDDDPVYRSHILSAVPHVDTSGGFMLRKGKSRGLIDGAVATAIALAAEVADVEEPYGEGAYLVH